MEEDNASKKEINPNSIAEVDKKSLSSFNSPTITEKEVNESNVPEIDLENFGTKIGDAKRQSSNR